MSDVEKKGIQKDAVYRLHEAKQNLACHRYKVEKMIGLLETALETLQKMPLRIVNWNNRALITHGEDEKVVYPSVEELVKAFDARQQPRKNTTRPSVNAGSWVSLSSVLKGGNDETDARPETRPGMKSPKEILLGIEQQNDVEARIKRRNLLNSLEVRLDAWIRELDERKHGPSGKEAARIADDLEPYLTELRSPSR